MKRYIYLPLFLILVYCAGCKSPDSILQPKNSCRLSTYSFKAQSKTNPLGGNTQTNETYTYHYTEKGEYTGYDYAITGTVTSATGIITSTTTEAKVRYEFDKDGFVSKRIVEGNTTSIDNRVPVSVYKNANIATTIYQYDVNGRVTQGDRSYATPNDQKVYSTSQEIYTYDNTGKLSAYILKDGTNQDPYVYSTYYTDGILTKYVVKPYSTAKEVEPYKIDPVNHSIQYGPDSDPVQKVTYSADGNIIRYEEFNFTIPFKKKEYEYDTKQNPFLTIPSLKGHPGQLQTIGFNFNANANNITRMKNDFYALGTFETTTYTTVYNSSDLPLSRTATDGSETYIYTYVGCN